ncbi:MAG: universal stress protein [Thermodesulfobacteriota bacterium]|nr:universal stress protein [Thermodesulfobacteriota bacterium]
MAIKTIAFCTDFSTNAEAAFVEAFDLARKYQAKLFLIHVLPPVINPLTTETEWVLPDEDSKSLILNLEERMQQEYGSRLTDQIDYELVVLNGHISSEILTFLEKNRIDLGVMGAYGLSGMGFVLFGSVAKRVVHKAPCSVMIVRSPKEVHEQI